MKYALLLVASVFPIGGTAAQAQTRAVCEGEFGTGSGLAGSYVGKECFLGADSPEERAVQRTCRQNSICRIEADIRLVDGRRLVARLHAIKQVSPPKTRSATYLQKLGLHLDGILAPSAKTCSPEGATAADRVSVLLEGAEWPAMQAYGEFCVALSGSGEEPTGDRPFKAHVIMSCGPARASTPHWPRADHETTRGVAFEVRSGMPGIAGAVVMDGVELTRCPIRREYTPLWWIENSSFKGRYPGGQ